MDNKMTSDNSKKFSIQTAARLSGLSAHTIRAWEKRYKALVPERFSNGRRLYNSQEVDRLIMLSELTKIGTSISQIAGLPDEDLKKIYTKIIQSPHLLSNLDKGVGKFDVKEAQRILLAAVSQYNVSLISQVLSEVRSSVDPKSFGLEILRPLLQEVYLRMEQKIYTKGQLQVLIAIAKFHAGNIIYSHIETSLKSSQKIIIASVEKEHHSFNLLISALLCCHHKKNFYYLNSDLPAQSIVEAVKATESNVLLLNVPDHHVSEAIPYLDEIYEAVGSKIKIWVRGDFDPKKINANRWKTCSHLGSDEHLDQLLLNT
jgi:DNA-binding transcriptional MerR regulator